jgi:hypothetical protein
VRSSVLVNNRASKIINFKIHLGSFPFVDASQTTDNKVVRGKGHTGASCNISFHSVPKLITHIFSMTKFKSEGLLIYSDYCFSFKKI